MRDWEARECQRHICEIQGLFPASKMTDFYRKPSLSCRICTGNRACQLRREREREGAGLGGVRVPETHLRDPRSLSRPQNNRFVPETELKLTNLYRKPSLSTYVCERVRGCGTGRRVSHICEIQGQKCVTTRIRNNPPALGALPRTTTGP